MSDLRNYLMLPQEMKCGLELHPIKLLDYEDFKELAYKYIVLDVPQLNNQRKQINAPLIEQKTLYDYLVALIEQDENVHDLNAELKKMEGLPKEDLDKLFAMNPAIKELWKNKEVYGQIKYQGFKNDICELFKMIIHKKVLYNSKLKCFDIYENNELKWVVAKNNFNEFRKIAMNQNLLFEPLIAPTKKAQKYIDASMSKNNNSEVDLEAVVAFVCTNSNAINISDYTYYRLRADFTSLMKQLNRNDIVNYTSGGLTKKNGKPLDIPNILEGLGVDKNPYDDVFKEKSND